MKVLRTPDSRFEQIADFPFEPKYLTINDLRIHYVDEGEGENTILCLHGEPSWSYLYRKMIPTLSTQHRVVAFDFIGFGRSDKFVDQKEYSFEMHYQTLQAVVEQLDLKNITLVVQDWGGLLGLPYATHHPERINKLVIMNTFVPSAKRNFSLLSVLRGLPFFAWKTAAALHPSLPVGRILQLGTYNKLSKDVIKAYNAPFPSRKYKAGAMTWPSIVPLWKNSEGAHYMRRTRQKLKNWQKPTLVMFSDKDPIMAGKEQYFYNTIPAAKQQPLITIQDAGHFLQEDKGEEIAGKILKFLEK